MHALIFGSNRGIGLEFCRKYKDAGYRITALCRQSNPELDSIAHQVFENVDATNFERIQQIAKEVEEIDLLIHVAGILRDESLEQMNFQSLQEQLSINSIGPMKSVVGLLPKLKAGSKVALLSSRMGSIADNDSGGRYGYRMSKAALNAAGKSLAIDLKEREIPVAILHPGYVRTEMTNQHGLIDPSESVWGMMKILEKLNLKNTGTFWHTNGEILPW